MTKEIETFDQCPKAVSCPFCSCIMELVRIEKKELIYRCPCCQKYKAVRRMTEKRFRAVVCVTDWYIEDKEISPFAVLTPHQASDLLNKLYEENERLKQQLKQSVFVNLDGEDGCWNCKYCYGGFCEILKNTTVSWLKGVSNCNLKKWELE